MRKWRVELGEIGPTDTPWILVSPAGISRIALIESEAWKALSAIMWVAACESTVAPNPKFLEVSEDDDMSIILKLIDIHLSFD